MTSQSETNGPAREKIAELAEADGEAQFAREVRAGCWDHRDDVAAAIAKTLTTSERLTLEWLSKEDFSQYGECKGTALNVLVDRGLAEIANPENGDWALVSLTETGWAAFKGLAKAS